MELQVPIPCRNLENKVTVTRLSLKDFLHDWLNHPKIEFEPREAHAQFTIPMYGRFIDEISCNVFYEPIILASNGTGAWFIIGKSLQTVAMINYFFKANAFHRDDDWMKGVLHDVESLNDVDVEWMLSRKMTLVVYENLDGTELHALRTCPAVLER